MGVPPPGQESPPPHTNVRIIIHDERQSVKPKPEGSATSDTQMREVIDLTGADASTRPTNEEIQNQENIIREAVLQQAAIGEKEELSSLAREYAEGAENEVFREKIEVLGTSYSSLRRTRGDGNCFYRSVLFSFMEQCLLQRDIAETLRFRDEVQKCKDKLTAQGFQTLVFEDALDMMVEICESLTAEPPLSLLGLIDKFSETLQSSYIIMFFRLVTSAEIQRRSEFFEPFILGLSELPVGVQKYCSDNVEPMGNESDHIEALAMTDALGVAVRVVYLDRTRQHGEDGRIIVNHHDFIPENVAAAAPGQPPGVVVLYRPGHYDVLYAKQK